MKLRRILALAMAGTLLLAALCGAAALAEGTASMPYRIEVDISSQIVTIYETRTGEIARQMLCSTGQNDTTPIGEITMQADEDRYRKPWHYIKKLRRFVRYPSRIRNVLLFHSLPYTEKSLRSLEPKAVQEFGLPVSHACIRLRWQDARFIADYCLPGTKVRIFKSGDRQENLRQLLLRESYDADRGFPYNSFLGVSDDPNALGRGSEGQAVRDLQYRLRDLGIFDGEMTGVYDGATVSAVRTAQYLLGEALTGTASEDFRQVLFSDDAPTAMSVALTEGMSGPAVRKLQENLATLRLYEGEPDGVYDGDVARAVAEFEQVYVCDVDGVASPQVQKAVDYETGKLLEAFGGAAYDVRKAGDKKHPQLVYTSQADGSVYTVGCSAEDYRAGAKKPSKAFAEYLAANDGNTDLSRLVNYVTVDTHGEAPALNLRQGPDSASDVLATVPDGASMRVERQYAEWTRVSYEGAEGYLMNRYLRFWPGTKHALDGDGAQALSADDVDYAQSKDGASVYDGDSDAAKLLGHLPGGAQLEVMDISGDWFLIHYRGHQGWVRGQDLELVMLDGSQP